MHMSSKLEQDQQTGKMMVTLPHGQLQQLEFDIATLRAAMITNDEACQTWDRLCQEKDREIERLRAALAAIFDAYNGNYEPEGRHRDLTDAIEQAMRQT